jgi:hypothetical protein
MKGLETNIQDAEYETSILMEAFTFVKHMGPVKKKGAYALGDMVSVYIDYQEHEDSHFSLYITCYAFGARIVNWDRMAVLLVCIQEKERVPLQCGFFNKNGYLAFPPLPDGECMVTPLHKFKEEIHLAPAVHQESPKDTGFPADFSLAAKGHGPGEPELFEFASLDGHVHGAFMTSGLETEIIMYTRDKELKNRDVFFAFINSVTGSIVQSGKIGLYEQEEDPAYLKGVWKGMVTANESVIFVFSDPIAL